MRCGCGLIAEAVELTRELCPIHPDCYRNDFMLTGHLSAHVGYQKWQEMRAQRPHRNFAVIIQIGVNDLAQRLQDCRLYSVDLRECGLPECAHQAIVGALDFTRELYSVHPDQHRITALQCHHSHLMVALSFRGMLCIFF